MSYRILDNLNTNRNHGNRLRELFDLADDVLITSPFLMPDFTHFLNPEHLSGLKRLHLITTLQPGAADQISKVRAFNVLYNLPAISTGSLLFDLSINNRLHGKIYLFKKETRSLAAIVTSANFTNNGLHRNHEWGIEIDDAFEIQQLETAILSSIEYSGISQNEVELMMQAIDALPRSPSPAAALPHIPLDLTRFVHTSTPAVAVNRQIKYWLKPTGSSDAWVDPSESYDREITLLHFSVKKPVGVRIGDILIGYSIGWGRLLGLFEVISEPQYVTDVQKEEEDWMECWPWYVEGRNLTPGFGANWWQLDLQLDMLRNEYQQADPDLPVTQAGNTGFGALSFGQDKLQLDSNFAAFVINRIMEINNRLG